MGNKFEITIILVFILQEETLYECQHILILFDLKEMDIVSRNDDFSSSLLYG